MYLVCIDLEFMARLYVVTIIKFHCQPVVTFLQDTSSHCVPTRMGPKGAFMYFYYYLVFFVFIYASEQH